MATDYEQYYQAQRHALGEPTKAFVTFFETLERASLTVLDLGCGQGRDALFIARLGHQVTGVDLSPTGIKDLHRDAEKEGLPIMGIVADLSTYEPDSTYDVVLIDRTLHMLDEGVRLEVLEKAAKCVNAGGYLLIADERGNLPAMHKFLTQEADNWHILKYEKGFLFAKKTPFKMG